MIRVLVPFGLLCIGLLLPSGPACPPRLEIGQTYRQIKAGPCPDIEAQANERTGDIVFYYCPSLSVQVMGDVTTGQMIGFVKIDYVPGSDR